MYNGKVISLGRIIWKVMKHSLASELSYEEAAEYALEFIKLVGTPLAYSNVISEPIPISLYKSRLPDDVILVKGIKYICRECSDDEAIAMTEATDIYHRGSQPVSKLINDYQSTSYPEVNSNQGYTYVIEKGVIKTSMEDGCIVISYKGLNIDDNGFPLVPDNEPFKMGMEYYILHRYLEPMWLAGKVTDKAFNYIEQKRHWYTASADTSMKMPSIDGMEAIMNGINRLIINTTAHENFFRTYGEKERLKKYN